LQVHGHVTRPSNSSRGDAVHDEGGRFIGKKPR
jgi:hypothetical protein